MTDILTPVTAMGQIAQIMRSDAEHGGSSGMQNVVEICERRAYDDDPEVRQLVSTVLYQYARLRGLDATLLTTYRTQ